MKSKVVELLSDQYIPDPNHEVPASTEKEQNRESAPKMSDREQTSFQLPTGVTPHDLLSISPSTRQEDSDVIFDATLALATRAIFGISVYDKPDFRDGDAQIKQTNCLWTKEMTLRQLLDREFPKSVSNEQLSGRFKERLVSLRSLVQHADIEIVWTKHLPDHLLLSYNKHNKTLSVFDLPSLIEVSYEASLGGKNNDSTIRRPGEYSSYTSQRYAPDTTAPGHFSDDRSLTLRTKRKTCFLNRVHVGNITNLPSLNPTSRHQVGSQELPVVTTPMVPHSQVHNQEIPKGNR